MSKSDDEDSNMYGDQDEENSITQNSDEEGEDIGYNRKTTGLGSDDDDDEEEEDEDEEEARKVNINNMSTISKLTCLVQVAEGFIVDDEDSDTSDQVAVRRKKRKKVEDCKVFRFTTLPT